MQTGQQQNPANQQMDVDPNDKSDATGTTSGTAKVNLLCY
jgi:hypothetical protein